jgi:hypothetical protein
MPEGSLNVRESQGSIGGEWKPGYVSLPKFREALTRVVVRNLPHFIWRSPPREPVVLKYHRRVGSSKPVSCEPIVLAYHIKELVVPVNLRMRVTLCM